jgi:hypothetical protein
MMVRRTTDALIVIGGGDIELSDRVDLADSSPRLVAGFGWHLQRVAGATLLMKRE